MRRNRLTGRKVILRAVLASLFLAIVPHLPAVAAPGDRLVAVYQARPAGDQGVTIEALAAVQQAIQQRLGAYGITDANVQARSSDQIVVDIPNTHEATAIVARIAAVGLCEFVGSDAHIDEGSTITTSLGGPPAVDPNASGTPPVATASANDAIYQTLLRGTDIADATVADYTMGPFPTITFTLTSAATQAFGDYTDGHTGRYISIIVDKRVVSSAMVQGRIDGVATVQGLDFADIRALAAFLRSGPLVLPLAVIDTRIVLATP